MRLTGQHTIHADVAQVWEALLDPEVLVRAIPGCERLEAVPSEDGDQAYAMTVTAGVAAIRGTYTGSCVLSDLVPHESLVMRLEGAGAPGTIDATVQVRFAGDGAETTVSYDADAVVGGMVGGVGQRMLASVSRRMAGELFGNVETAITGADAPGASDPAAGGGGEPRSGVFTAPGRPVMPSSSDFAKGIAVGAGLVLLGVLLGRRR